MSDTDLKRAFGRVVDKLALFNLDEVLAFEFIVDGVNAGAVPYGRFNAATDDRDMPMEGAAELRDYLHYDAFEEIKKRLAMKRRRECRVADFARAGVEEVD